jgi:AcrR family transcriptional regulator
MSTVQKIRRSQEERSADTRRRLLDATFDCLVEIGYARTSTPEVLRRTGISRGALLHHFPTKTDLVAATMDYVFDKRLAEYRKAFENLEVPEGESKVAAGIDMLWNLVRGPTYHAWLELVVAARTDPGLMAKIRQVDARFDRQAGDLRQGFFPPGGVRDQDIYKIGLRFVFATLNGLSLVGIHEDHEELQPVVEALKQLASLVDRHQRG